MKKIVPTYELQFQLSFHIITFFSMFVQKIISNIEFTTEQKKGKTNLTKRIKKHIKSKKPLKHYHFIPFPKLNQNLKHRKIQCSFK